MPSGDRKYSKGAVGMKREERYKLLRVVMCEIQARGSDVQHQSVILPRA